MNFSKKPGLSNTLSTRKHQKKRKKHFYTPLPTQIFSLLTTGLQEGCYCFLTGLGRREKITSLHQWAFSNNGDLHVNLLIIKYYLCDFQPHPIEKIILMADDILKILTTLNLYEALEKINILSRYIYLWITEPEQIWSGHLFLSPLFKPVDMKI